MTVLGRAELDRLLDAIRRRGFRLVGPVLEDGAICYGDISSAADLIVPPTSQNQRVIETDLREFAGPRLDLPHDELTWQCEQAVRNHDPCISCSAHFLDLRVLNRRVYDHQTS